MLLRTVNVLLTWLVWLVCPAMDIAIDIADDTTVTALVLAPAAARIAFGLLLKRKLNNETQNERKLNNEIQNERKPNHKN